MEIKDSGERREEWRDVKEYEGYYQVSNIGRVKRLKITGNDGRTYRERILIPVYNTRYLNVSLCKNGIIRQRRVHRLVCEAFVENPNNYPCINHKDENRLNNNANNLEWCTYKYNNSYGTVIKRRSKVRCRAVIQMDLKGQKIKKWDSVKDASNYFKVRNSGIIAACKGRQITSAGYKWRYAKRPK